MRIVHIFVDENSEGLHSIHYPTEKLSEYYRLFENWNDYQYLFNFCKKNQHLIFTEFWGINNLERFVDIIIEEAGMLEKQFLDYDESGLGIHSGYLQSIFLPLDNYARTVPMLQESKAKADVIKPKLRLYALRVEKNIFILTGGCIKLTLRMSENEFTRVELEKIEVVKNFLKMENIFTQDDLICYHEQ